MKRKILIAVFSFLVSSLIIALESGGKDIESLVISNRTKLFQYSD